MLPSLKAFYHIGKTRTAFRQVRRIDLRDIAEAHDLGPRASACDERLHLFGREVLCLIDDDKLLQNVRPRMKLMDFTRMRFLMRSIVA